MIQSPKWRGGGYAGARENFKEALLTKGHHSPKEKLLAKADDMALTQANRLGYTADQLFDWANSRKGSQYGESWFSHGGKYANRHAPAPLNQ